MSTLVIAEAGSTHEGSFERALELIEAAKGCGADAVKFQWTSDPDKLAFRRNAQDRAAVYRQYLAWPAKWHEALAAHCARVGIKYACTAYLKEDIPIVAPHVAFFKVASFESQDRQFVEAHYRHKKTVIVSTGMSYADEVAWLALHKDLAIPLHCVSAYPAPVDEINLWAIGELSIWFDRVGLSDHTTSTLTGALAVACGATVIEKHICLPTTELANPDYIHSLGPVHFGAYVENIREAERAVGNGKKAPQDSEEPMRRYMVRGQ